LKYRPEIDGLRALAVLPVVLFHLGICKSGYLGVDVFFVISGYLITGIILPDIYARKFDFLSFYDRRARRLLPALFVVLAFSLATSSFFLTAKDFEYFYQSLIGASTFSSNIIFWHQVGYFDIEAHLKPLLHTWSLAVEEQFYIIFPMFLVAVIAVFRRALLGIALVVGFCSLLLAIWGFKNYPTPAFYLLPTRGWELMVGVLAQIVERRGYINKLSQYRTSETFAPAAFGVLLFLLLFVESDLSNGIVLQIIAVFCAGVILVTAHKSQPIIALLSVRPIVVIGLMSYSIYLWHFPLIALGKYNLPSIDDSWLAVTCLITLTGICSYLTWRFVESPIRRIKTPKRTANLLLFSVAFGSLVLIAGLINEAKYNSSDFNAIKAEILRSKFHERRCSGRANSAENCDLQSSRTVLIVGDSMWTDALNILSISGKFEYKVSELAGCPPYNDITGIAPSGHVNLQSCLSLNKDRFSADLSETDAVAIIVRYGWFKPSHLQPYLDYIKNQGIKNILVFGNFYAMDQPMDRVLLRYDPKKEKFDTYIERHLKFGEIQDEDFSWLQDQYGFSLISIWDSACNRGVCEYMYGGVPFTYDHHHYTVEFSERIAKKNKKVISEFLGLR
jgi:peptidoglycan/LPS O-acetylase OafA/YrhL